MFDQGVALVTGGGSGLGRAVAKHLTTLGAKVYILDVAAEAERVAEEIGAGYVQADIASEDAVVAAIRAVAVRGEIRIAVLCAGGTTFTGRVVSRGGQIYPVERFRQTVDVNLIGSYHVLVHVAAHMAKCAPIDDDGQRGVIINTSSIAGLDGATAEVAYASAKSGVIGMTLAAARDLSVHGIRVVAIAPGFFDTPLTQRVVDRSGVTSSSLLQQGMFPNRQGRPAEFAQTVEFVVRNSYINGTCIRIDGGCRMS